MHRGSPLWSSSPRQPHCSAPSQASPRTKPPANRATQQRIKDTQRWGALSPLAARSQPHHSHHRPRVLHVMPSGSSLRVAPVNPETTGTFTTVPAQPSGATPVTINVKAPPDATPGFPNNDTDTAYPVKSPSGSAKRYLHRASTAVRRGFIRKVFGLLLTQLAFTAAVAFYFSGKRNFVSQHSVLLWLAIGTAFSTLILLSCVSWLSTTFPINYVCLAAYTVAQSYIVGAISAFYSTETLAIAVLATAVVVIGLSLFAHQSKIDFTNKTGLLVVLTIGLLAFGYMTVILRHSVATNVFMVLGVVVFSTWVVVDIQMIMGGKNRASTYTPDDYVFAALSLYVDVVNLFSFVVTLCAGEDGAG